MKKKYFDTDSLYAENMRGGAHISGTQLTAILTRRRELTDMDMHIINSTYGIMKCNNDCFHCTRPASKCHGGNKRTANPVKGCNRLNDGKGDTIKQSYRVGHKKTKGGY